eukprot:1357607-Pyramimonas_sp.AAC.1
MSQAKREICRGCLMRNERFVSRMCQAKQAIARGSSEMRDLPRMSQAKREIRSRMSQAKQELTRGRT